MPKAYHCWSISQLKAELEERGACTVMTTRGLREGKAQLVQRLEILDASTTFGSHVDALQKYRDLLRESENAIKELEAIIERLDHIKLLNPCQQQKIVAPIREAIDEHKDDIDWRHCCGSRALASTSVLTRTSTSFVLVLLHGRWYSLVLTGILTDNVTVWYRNRLQILQPDLIP